MATEDSSIHTVLESLASAFETNDARLGEIKATNPPDEYWEFIADEEQSILHALFGAAFVTCQAYIESVAHRASRFHRHLVHDLHALPRSLPKEKWGIRNLTSSSPSEIALIHELANYFKHADQWDYDEWRVERKRSKHTIRALKDWGFIKKDPLLLEEGARKLGVFRGQQVTELGELFHKWGKDVYNAAKLDLETANRKTTKRLI